MRVDWERHTGREIPGGSLGGLWVMVEKVVIERNGGTHRKTSTTTATREKQSYWSNSLEMAREAQNRGVETCVQINAF